MFERIPKSPQEQEEQTQTKPPVRERSRSRERAGRFLNTCGMVLLGAFIEFVGTAHMKAAETPFPETESKPTKVLYRSAESERELKNYERFYPNFSEMKTPLVIGRMEEEIKRFDDVTRALYETRFGDVGAFALPGSQIPSEKRAQFGVGVDTMYIFYGTGEMPPESKMRIPYHEGLHALHFAEQRTTHPEDSLGYMRHQELSREVNMYLEELVTGAETIAWLTEQARDPKAASLSDQDAALLPKAIRREQQYFRDNYSVYYQARYGHGFDVPAGERSPSDPIDQRVEELLKSSGALAVFGDFSNE